MIFYCFFMLAHFSYRVSALCSVRDKVLPAGWPDKARKWDFLPDPILTFSFGRVPEYSSVFCRT